MPTSNLVAVLKDTVEFLQKQIDALEEDAYIDELSWVEWERSNA
jgi:cell division protein FtsB